jgi:hypothetical protein
LARVAQIKKVFLNTAGEDEDMDAGELRQLLNVAFTKREYFVVYNPIHTFPGFDHPDFPVWTAVDSIL